MLGRDAFVAKRSLASVTERCEAHEAALDANDAPLDVSTGGSGGGSTIDVASIATILRVVDTPGTCDSGALLEDNLRHISEYLRSQEGGGIHALVLVLSASARFTQEEAIAMERLVARLGEGVMAHALAVFTRGGEVTREGGTVEDLMASAPPSLTQLLRRMRGAGLGAGGSPVLVENFPSGGEGDTRAVTATAPLLAAVRRLIASAAPDGAAAYTPAQLADASRAAEADPSTAALAMLDRLKRQLASGPAAAAFGRHPQPGGDPQRDAMARAAMAAFSDLQAQFAARAGLGLGGASGSDGGGGHPMMGGSGIFGAAASDASSVRVTDRPRTRFGADALRSSEAMDLGSSAGVWVEVAGAGDLTEARGDIGAGPGGGVLSFDAASGGSNPGGGNRAGGRVRLAGRLIVRGGDAVIASAPTLDAGAEKTKDAPIVTLRSPMFVSGPATLAPVGPVTDDDWVDEGVYRCTLRRVGGPTPDQDGRLEQTEVTATVRGVSPGDAVPVAVTCGPGTTLELQGGSLSLQNGAVRWSSDGDGGDLEVDATLDATPELRVGFDGPDAARVACLGGAWPWQR